MQKESALTCCNRGGRYAFVVTGHFLAEARGVYFGIHIRSTSGVEITGQRYPAEGSHIETIAAGTRFRIAFPFHLDLLPGVYFSGGGVWSAAEASCLHRVMDATMFRVNSDEAQVSFGYCDLHDGPADLRLA